MSYYKMMLFAAICGIGIVTADPALIATGINGALQADHTMEE